MVRTPKSKKREDGKGYEQTGKKRKSGLNKAILDASIGQVRAFLESKGDVHPNRQVIRVPSQYTSQKCSQCGQIDKKNRRSQATFECVNCGFTINADLNAAINMEAYVLESKKKDK